ncbi:MAG: tyrosine-protein phosphatase [bacterium]
MTRATTETLAKAQRDRLQRFKTAECVDIHCHCLPGLDDGPPDEAAALQLCQALVADGVTTVIATPHQLGRFDGQVAADDIREAARRLNETLDARGVPLSVLPGADVRVDERIPRLLDSDQILTLADERRYLLLEMPPETLFDIRPLLDDLADRGVTPIISHPERSVALRTRPEAVRGWLERGALLQVTAASLLGDFGPAPRRLAWHWLRTGEAALVASDAHDTDGRAPRASAAIEAVARRLGTPAAHRACIVNPLHVLAGKRIPSLPHRRRSRP